MHNSWTAPRCFTSIWTSCVSQLAPLPQALPSPGEVCKLNGCWCPKANQHTTGVSMAKKMEQNVAPQKKASWGTVGHCEAMVRCFSHGTIKSTQPDSNSSSKWKPCSLRLIPRAIWCPHGETTHSSNRAAWREFSWISNAVKSNFEIEISS